MRTRVRLLLVLALVLLWAGAAANALGQQQPAAPGPEAAAERDWPPRAAQIVGLVVLVACLAWGAWQWQRRKGMDPEAAIRVVSVKALGQREKVAILEMLGSRLVVGVTAQRITLLLREPGANPAPERSQGQEA